MIAPAAHPRRVPPARAEVRALATALACLALLLGAVRTEGMERGPRKVEVLRVQGVDPQRIVDKVRQLDPDTRIEAMPSEGAVILYDTEERIAMVRRIVGSLDRPVRQYAIDVRTVETGSSFEGLRRLGFDVVSGGGDFVQLDPTRSRTELSDVLTRSRAASSQRVIVREGGTASTFAGISVPVQTSTQVGGTVLTNTTTMDAGKRLVIRAVRALGDDGVELAVSTESTNITAVGRYPASEGARTETVVQARLGEPVVLASLDSTVDNVTRDGGGTGSIRLQETRRGREWTFRPRRLQRESGGSFGWGQARRQRGGTVLVVLTPRAAGGPAPRRGR